MFLLPSHFPDLEKLFFSLTCVNHEHTLSCPVFLKIEIQKMN